MNVFGGEVDVSFKIFDVDVNVVGLDVTFKVDVKFFKIKKFMFGKMYFLDVEFDIKLFKFKAEVFFFSFKMEGEIYVFDVDISLLGINVEGFDIRLKFFKVKVLGVDVLGLKVEGDLKGFRV